MPTDGVTTTGNVPPLSTVAGTASSPTTAMQLLTLNPCLRAKVAAVVLVAYRSVLLEAREQQIQQDLRRGLASDFGEMLQREFG
jgi:hypothetical protein